MIWCQYLWNVGGIIVDLVCLWMKTPIPLPIPAQVLKVTSCIVGKKPNLLGCKRHEIEQIMAYQSN